MANLILRPTADGQYQAWNGISGGGSYTPLYQLIDEADADGDTTYVYADSSAAFTVSSGTAVAGSWPRATRIPSIRVVATVRTTGSSATFRFRLRVLGTDYDSDDITITNTTYVEIDQRYDLIPNGYGWDTVTLDNTEFGLVFRAGDQLRCTKLETFVHYEPFPHYTLSPEADGIIQQWTPHPSTSPAYMVVGGIYDGDLSYLEDQTINNQASFDVADLPATLSPANIDRVALKGIVKNVGTTAHAVDLLLYSGSFYRGGTNTTAVVLPPDNEWHLLSEDYLNDPGGSWPSGNPAATPWTAAEVNALEAAIENSGGGDFRCTGLALEVWLAPTPSTTIDLLPTADGYHTDWSTIVPGAPAWNTVNETPPDDATSYVLLDADTAGTPVYASFTVGGAGSVPAGERIYNVEWRCRVRLGNLPHSQAWLAPVLRSTGGTPETYVGRPQLIEGTAGTWFDVKWDFLTDPYDADDAPWANLAAVTGVQFGMAVLSGAMLLSRVRAQVQTAVDYRGSSGATDLILTDAVTSPIGLLARSRAEGLIYQVKEFAVGTGGYDVTDPVTVLATDPFATALANAVYRGLVEHVEFDGASEPNTVDYWCRVPRAAGQGGIGEIGLFYEILWSPVAGEIGTTGLFAIAHHPCQSAHDDDVDFYDLQVSFPASGSELLVDGDMEAATPAAWTAGNNATLSKQSGTPHGGSQVLRVAYNAVNDPQAYQTILTIGEPYRFIGWARGDSTYAPSILMGTTTVWTGTASTSWQKFELVVGANATTFVLQANATGVGYCEFDDCSVVVPFDAIYGPQLFVDGDMEAATPAAWAAGNFATLSKETTDPYEGTRLLRVTDSGTPNPYTYQASVLTIGKTYRLTGWARPDGLGCQPRVGNVPNAYNLTASPVWQRIDYTYVATAVNSPYFYAFASSTGEHCDFDGLTLTELT